MTPINLENYLIVGAILFGLGVIGFLARRSRRQPSRRRTCPPPAWNPLTVPTRPAMFDDPGGYLWLIPALPLLASIIIAAFGYQILREKSHWVCIAGAAGACVFSCLAFAD